jgi:hypothetical protein
MLLTNCHLSLDLSYSVYKIKKRNGKYRTITAPNDSLKIVQSNFADYLYNKYQDIFKSNNYITGFVQDKSIKQNSKLHLKKEWVVNIDIKDFFPSITSDLITKYLSEDSEFNNNKIIDICCYEGRLPQGSPCSPIIANLIAYWILDPEIVKIAEEEGFIYSRYADDLTFSTDKIIDRNKVKEVVNKIVKQINLTKVFKVNPAKVNIKHRSQKQIVTGILVNNNESKIPKKITNKLRAILHTHKMQNKPLSINLNGVLQYVKQINEQQFNKLTKDFPCKLLTSDYLNHNLNLKDLQKHLDSLS